MGHTCPSKEGDARKFHKRKNCKLDLIRILTKRNINRKNSKQFENLDI